MIPTLDALVKQWRAEAQAPNPENSIAWHYNNGASDMLLQCADELEAALSAASSSSAPLETPEREP